VYTARVPTSATEVVRRPEPGLARGVWEMRPAAFYVVGALVVIAAALWGAARLGLLRRRKTRRAAR
jgi:hypothetical protein